MNFHYLRKPNNTESMMAPLTEHVDSGSFSEVWMEGYLDYTTSKKSDSWERKFFVLKVIHLATNHFMKQLGIRFVYL